MTPLTVKELEAFEGTTDIEAEILHGIDEMEKIDYLINSHPDGDHVVMVK